MARATLAVIVGNRDFFPDKLVTEARQDILALFAEMDIEAVMLDENATKLGGVETWDDAKRCAELFRNNAGRIDGILVCLPNFGDEKGVADTDAVTPAAAVADTAIATAIAAMRAVKRITTNSCLCGYRDASCASVPVPVCPSLPATGGSLRHSGGR